MFDIFFWYICDVDKRNDTMIPIEIDYEDGEGKRHKVKVITDNRITLGFFAEGNRVIIKQIK